MSEKLSLEDVLQEYGYEAGEENGPSVLNKFVKEYPQFYDELMDFAASQSLLKYVPETELTPEEDKHYREFGVEQLHAFLKKKPVAITSLNGVAKEQGMDKNMFAETLGVTISLLTYLEKRRLRYASIPGQFIKKIADNVKVTEESVAAYLRGGPEMSTQASFKAESRPRVAGEKDFFEAVKEDPGLTDEQRQTLIEMK